jgi:signal transduction histidine kinase
MADGNPTAVQLPEALAGSEVTRKILEGIGEAVTITDDRGKLVFANQSAATLLGFPSPSALLGATGKEILARYQMFGADGAPFSIENLPSRAALKGQPGPEVLMQFLVSGSHEARWSLVRSVPLPDAQGKVTHAINLFREVTDEMRDKQQRTFLLKVVDELNTSLDYEKTLASVARLAVPVLADWCAVDLVEGDRTKRVAIAHIDPEKIAFVAELEKRYPSDPSSKTGVPEILRSGKAELVPHIPRDLILAGAKDPEHLRLIDALQLGSYVGVPLRVRGKTIGAFTMVMAESGRRYNERDLELAQQLADRAALAIDNSRLFREVEQARAAAVHDAEFAQSFIGILGHDLRNPLNAVMMAARLLKKKSTTADAVTIERINASSKRMNEMVRQLLDLTRSRLASGIALDRRESDLAQVVTGIVDELKAGHPERAIDWRPAGEVKGFWDPDRLGQVVSNLVGNALVHGDPAKPVVIRVAQPGSDAAELEVRNHGPSIPADVLPRLFEPYRRQTANDRRSEGLGLGLFISQQIVHAHGGAITVKSTPEEGTMFKVTLPRALPLATAGAQ